MCLLSKRGKKGHRNDEKDTSKIIPSYSPHLKVKLLALKILNIYFVVSCAFCSPMYIPGKGYIPEFSKYNINGILRMICVQF